MKGLTPQTALVFEDVSKMECLKDLTLCGGTAISLQIGHRLSEDLDFELISTKTNSLELDFEKIINEINTLFPGSRREILGDEHFQMFLPQNVKLSFFKPKYKVPSLHIGYQHNNVRALTLQEMLGQKIYTTAVRSCFRDYYDIYCLLREGTDLVEGVKYACDFSKHTIHSKHFLQGLATPGLYRKDKNFDTLFQTKYKVSPEEICEWIRYESLRSQNISLKR